MIARALVPALALAAAITWAVAPGSAQNAAPAAAPDQSQTYHHPDASEGPMGGPMFRGGMRFWGGGPGMMGGGMGGGMMSMMGGMMAGNPGVMADHVEGRLAFLKTELKITEAQTAQWTKFADAMRATAGQMNGMHQQMMQGGLPDTLPDRLNLHEQMLSSHLEALKDMRAALDPLYASFSDEQKKLADDLMAGPMGMM
jgi:LTXXQ motif family protein